MAGSVTMVSPWTWKGGGLEVFVALSWHPVAILSPRPTMSANRTSVVNLKSSGWMAVAWVLHANSKQLDNPRLLWGPGALHRSDCDSAIRTPHTGEEVDWQTLLYCRRQGYSHWRSVWDRGCSWCLAGSPVINQPWRPRI